MAWIYLQASEELAKNKYANSSESQDSTYYPYFLEFGRSMHLEYTHEGKVNIWDSKMIKEGMTRDEALEFLYEIYMRKIKDGNSDILI